MDKIRSEQGYNTRPIIMGSKIVVASGHHLASSIGKEMKEIGGNAFDAGVAMVFAQTLLECHTFGLGGEVPILIYSAKEKKVISVNGNTNAPIKATIEEYKKRGVTKLIPGDGLLAASVCAVPGTLIKVLSNYGKLTLKEVLHPTIKLAKEGFPLDKTFVKLVKREAVKFKNEWPTSEKLFLKNGKTPQIGDHWNNPDLYDLYKNFAEVEEKNKFKGREVALEAVHDYFYKGEIAEKIVRWQKENKFKDSLGIVSNGLLTTEDFNKYKVKFEKPVTVNYCGYDIFKCPPWSQGPVMLQILNILENYNLKLKGFNSAEYIHVLIEAMKLGFADREKYYGDPRFVDVPLEGLLSKQYSEKRSRLIENNIASNTAHPGNPYFYEGREIIPDISKSEENSWSGGTTGTRAIDEEGNMFSATPSGGWFSSSPIIEGLGFSLGTRMQMFWLGSKKHPGVLFPEKQPRTTLSPSLVLKNKEPYLVLGTPGGDQQDQWQLQVLLNIIHFDMDLQQAIDAPNFEIGFMPSSFYPREVEKLIRVEGRVPSNILKQLSEYEHNIKVEKQWSQNAITAIMYNAKKRLIQGGASSRRESMYAMGR